jgi:hypothetical protein
MSKKSKGVNSFDKKIVKKESQPILTPLRSGDVQAEYPVSEGFTGIIRRCSASLFGA